MHTEPVPETAGNFSDETALPDVPCRKCKQIGNVIVKDWESSCGGYEDYKYTCKACNHVWWIDGIDS